MHEVLIQNWFLSSPEAAVVNKLLPLSLLLTLSSRGEPRAGMFANTDSQETLFIYGVSGGSEQWSQKSCTPIIKKQSHYT